MNRLYKALLTVGLTVFSLDSIQAATVTWTNGAADNLWSSTANWSTNAEPTSADTVVLGSNASGTIFVDTSNPPISNPIVAIQSLNFTNTNGALTLDPFLNEQFQLSGDISGNLITNTSGFVQTISLPVFLTGNGVVAGGTGLNIGTLDTAANTITTTGNVTVTSGITFTIASSSTFGTINATSGNLNFTGANINVLATPYSGVAGDVFQFSNNGFAGANIGSLATLNTGLVFVDTDLLSQGFLYVDGNIISTGQTLTVNNDVTGSPNSFAAASGVFLDGGELVSTNNGGTPFGTGRRITLNLGENSTIAAAAGTVATYSGVIADQGGTGTPGTLTIGDALNTGTVEFTQNALYTGATTITANSTLQLGDGTTAGLFDSSNIVDNGHLVLALGFDAPAITPISGSGSVEQRGPGVVTITVTGNSYSGGTLVTGGTLKIGGAGVTLGATTGSLLVSSAVLDLNGVNETVGTSTLTTGTITTSTGTPTLTTSGVTVNGAGNLIDTGVTVTGAISQAAGSTLMVSGTAGADSLANGATTLTGAGTVGAVTLNGGNTITGNGTLTTGGVTVNGTNNTLTGTVAGTETINASSALADNGTVSGNVILGTGTLSGTGTVTGTTGVTGGTVNGNGLTLTGLTTFNGSGNTLSGTDTATGGINLAAGATVAESGVQTGTVNLTSGATTLSGSGTVGAVTLHGGGNTITGNGTLTTGGVTVNGTNNTLTGTVVGTETINASSALADNGTVSGNVILGTGTLSGTGTVTGTTGVTGGTVNGNGLTLTGLTTFNGSGNTLSGTDTATGGINLAAGATVAESGVQTGTVNLTNGATTLSGSGTIGAVTLNGGGNTITGNSTLTTGGVTIIGSGNTLTGTVTGAITQNGSSTLTVNGTGGSDALASGAALAGTGTVTTVTLAGNNTLSSLGTLHTTSISVSGTGNVISSGTVAGSTTINNGGVLTDNAAMTGTLLVSNGGTFGGTGTAGATTVAANGAINLENNSIGTLTVGGLSIGTAGTPSILSFDLQTGGTNTVDKIQDNGTLTLTGAGGTTININALGVGALNDGSYVLLNATGAVTGNLSDLTLNTTSLGGKTLSLSLVGGNLDLVIADPTVPVGTTYNLSTVAGATRIMSGQSTTLTTTITNTGTGLADTLDFTGLGATGTTVAGATTSGGPLANGGGAASNVGQTFSDTTAGAHTVNPTVATATNPNVGGNATLGSSTGTTIDVLNNRTVNTTSVALGRVLVNQTSGTLTTTLSSATNLDDSLTRITLGAGAQTIGVTNGTITLGAGAAYQFGGPIDDATNSTIRGVSGSFTTTGNQAGTATVAVTGEGLTGEVDNPVTVAYTADAVAKRTITNGASTNLGVFHSGDTVTGTSSAFTTTGLTVDTTSVSVAAGSGTADANGVTLTGGPTTFDGSALNQSDTRTFGGTLTSNTGGAVTGTFNLAVTTLENGGAGLTGEGTYNPVAVAYSGFVYTGQGVYTAAGSSSWGTVSAAPANWTANGGVPGLDPNFVSTDSATFGNSIGATAATVTLDGDSPSLKAVTFNNTLGGSYTIAQGTGGTLKLNNGAGTATITDASGNNTISAPLELDSNASASVASGDTLALSGNISDVGGKSLTVSGPGTTILSGANSFSGGTTLSSGTLDANSATSLGSGPLTVGGGTLDLDGLGHTVGAVNITGASTIQNGTLTGASYTDSAAGGTTTIGAALAGGGALTKTGGDTLALNGANSYTGGTSISAGTVAVGNASALGNGNVTFSGGTLETGNGVHQINVTGNYTQTGGTLVLNLTGTGAGASPGYEFLNVSGTANLGGALRVNVSSPYVSNVGDAFTFVQAGAINGGFTSVSTNLFSLSITLQGAGVIIAQVPIATLPGVTYSSNESAVATYIDNSFHGGANSPGFVTLMTSLDNVINGGNPQEITGALDQLTPNKFSNFARTTVFNNAIFSTQLFDSFLQTQRSENGDFVMGNGQIDSTGLSIVGPNMDAGLGQVESHMLAWNPAPLAHGLLSDTVDPVTAGLDMKQVKPAPANDKNSLFNAFILGNVVLAQGFSQQDVAHSDSTTGAVTVGGSFRITPHLRAGIMMAYGHTDADLDTLGSKATVDSYAPGLFVSYDDSGWYANALASYGFDSFTEDRNVSFGGLNGTAHGAPTGSQIVGNLDGGYDFHLNKWTFGPTAGVQYTHLTVDGFSEDGLDPVDLNVGRQETDSLRSHLGGHVAYVFQTGKVLLTPHLDASWQHEFMDQSRGITSQFNTVGVGSFTIQTPSPSRDSALIDAGLDAQLNGQVSLYLDYLVQAGQDNYFGQAVQAGVKVGF